MKSGLCQSFCLRAARRFGGLCVDHAHMACSTQNRSCFISSFLTGHSLGRRCDAGA